MIVQYPLPYLLGKKGLLGRKPREVKLHLLPQAIARKMSVPSIGFANGHLHIRVMAINSHDSIENTNRKH